MNSLYSKVLGDAFHRLSPLLQRFHTVQDETWRGEARVHWSSHPGLRLLLRMGGLPKEAEQCHVTVSVVSKTSSEVWLRRFGERNMRSKQKWVGQSLHECFGPVSLTLDNRVEKGALKQTSLHSKMFGVPLPRPFRLRVSAREWQEGERFNFDVDIGLANWPLIRYSGWLRPQGRET